MSRPMGWCLQSILVAGCAGGTLSTTPPEPAPVWLRLVGEYATGPDTLSILEDRGLLVLRRWTGEPEQLNQIKDSAFQLAAGPTQFVFEGWHLSRPTALRLDDHRYLALRFPGNEPMVPQRPVAELRQEAAQATPPEEAGSFLPDELVELVALDSTIRLDIRYASDHNFMGTPFYSSARAFLQRPAAEALVRANRQLRKMGFGLLVHDGYRPWSVTMMFWEATPEPQRIFVADPAQGSRHNRGCAVDLTLFDLTTGLPVTMPGGYDEMSPRSFPDYPGGTSRQRWLRDLLRRAMESEGFAVYQAEWWHFDYQDWPRYRIGNQTFEEIS